MKSMLHDNEIPIDVELVRKLVDSKFPHYAKLSLVRLYESGSTNVLFRLGDNLLVRLPRQPGGSVAIEKEQRWMTEIGSNLPVAVPKIVAVCEPAFKYSERWSVVRWIDGKTPNVCSPNEPSTPARLRLAADLADAVGALRKIKVPLIATNDSAMRCYRGRPLAQFDKLTRHNIQNCRSMEGLNIDLDAALNVWEEAMALPDIQRVGVDRWYHGDLVAENLLISDGKLSAILDFGGLAVGDATIDLHGAWELFDTSSRELFRSRLEVGNLEWLRGRAWALGISLNAITYYWKKMPNRMNDRLAMVQSVLSDFNRSHQ